MEEENRESLGGGIITISVIHFIGAAITIIGALGVLFLRDMVNEALETMPFQGELRSTMDYILSLVLVAILVVGLILILNRKVVGVYIYGGYVVFNTIMSIVTNGFDIFSILISLLLPVLMGIFIYQKKNIFWPSAEEY